MLVGEVEGSMIAVGSSLRREIGSKDMDGIGLGEIVGEALGMTESLGLSLGFLEGIILSVGSLLGSSEGTTLTLGNVLW